jgi:hypothetical protein
MEEEDLEEVEDQLLSPLKCLCEIKISGLSEMLGWFGGLKN